MPASLVRSSEAYVWDSLRNATKQRILPSVGCAARMMHAGPGVPASDTVTTKKARGCLCVCVCVWRFTSSPRPTDDLSYQHQPKAKSTVCRADTLGMRRGTPRRRTRTSAVCAAIPSSTNGTVLQVQADRITCM